MRARPLAPCLYNALKKFHKRDIHLSCSFLLPRLHTVGAWGHWRTRRRSLGRERRGWLVCCDTRERFRRDDLLDLVIGPTSLGKHKLSRDTRLRRIPDSFPHELILHTYLLPGWNE